MRVYVQVTSVALLIWQNPLKYIGIVEKIPETSLDTGIHTMYARAITALYEQWMQRHTYITL